jgi:Tubulin/FtsZ family, GTPase domain
MALCPNKHDNPPALTICRTCGLPVVDIRQQSAFLTTAIRSKSVLARPKTTSILVGVGTFGVSIVNSLQSLNNEQKALRLAYISIDTIGDNENTKLDTDTSFFVALGQDSMGSTFCGRAENLTISNPSLTPVLRKTGFRERDENQSVVLALALGGGTASGASYVVLERARALNPGCFNYVLSIMPSATDSVHSQINAFYGLSKLLQSSNNCNLSDAVVLIQYDRLKQLRGVGASGEELKMEGLLAVLFRLMVSTLTGPGASKIGTLLRWTHAPVIIPCLAVGRSLEIFGSLSNILESSVAYPLCQIEPEKISSSYLLLKVPKRLAKNFPDIAVTDELNAFCHKHFPSIGSISHKLYYSDEQHDRIDACLLLGGDNSALSTTVEAYEKFKRGVKSPGDWERYGLTKEKITDAERILASYTK